MRLWLCVACVAGGQSDDLTAGSVAANRPSLQRTSTRRKITLRSPVIGQISVRELRSSTEGQAAAKMKFPLCSKCGSLETLVRQGGCYHEDADHHREIQSGSRHARRSWGSLRSDPAR